MTDPSVPSTPHPSGLSNEEIEHVFEEASRPEAVAKAQAGFLWFAALLLEGVAFICLESLVRDAPAAAVSDRDRELAEIVRWITTAIWLPVLVVGIAILARLGRRVVVAGRTPRVGWWVAAWVLAAASMAVLVLSVVVQYRILELYEPVGKRLASNYAESTRAWNAEVVLAVLWCACAVWLGERWVRRRAAREREASGVR